MPPTITFCSRGPHNRGEMHGQHVTTAPAPVRILVPPGCVAEVFSVPQGTEIKIRYSSKVPELEPEDPGFYEI